MSMRTRPRCRLWLPLTTQQLRLRNLVRILGVNIEFPETDSGAFIYYTLHHTKDGQAFYMSEALPQRQRQQQQKWAEIVCPEMMKSNANCVCVKVWARIPNTQLTTHSEKQSQESQEPREPISALSKELLNTCLSPSNQPRPPDQLLFMWGVYFSGLILISQQTDAKCSVNSLIFHINGEYFASPEHFTVENLREQLSLNYQRYSTSVPKNSALLPNESINSPHVSRSSSPQPFDWQRDLLQMSKTRYIQLNIPRCDVRVSYNLQKLLQIQKLQRLQLQKFRESKELRGEIEQRSVLCITKDQLLCKPRTTSLSSLSALHQYQRTSMGRTLSVLLAEQQEISPHTLLQTQDLLRQLETLRSKHRLLQSERKTYSTRIAQQCQRLNAVKESREVLQTWLATRRNQLKREQEKLELCYRDQMIQLQRKLCVTQHVEYRMSALCIELRDIYPIGRNHHGFYTICGVPFPNMEAYVSDPKYASSISNSDNVLPMALSASLGYIAHLVQMISVIINRPLRNPIIHEGSRSRIVDAVKDIAYASREFPLYSRSTIPSKTVKYAIYLLNQNIAQLCYDITGTRCDLRGTIENILSIFSALADVEQNQMVRGFNTISNTHPNQRLDLHNNSNSTNCMLSKSSSYVDMENVPVPLDGPKATISSLLQMPSSQPLPIVEGNIPQLRICRSVGSYSDCEEDFKDINEHCYSNSDSNIKFQSEQT